MAEGTVKKRKRKKHRFFWFTVKLQIVLMILVLGTVSFYYFSGYADEVKDLLDEAKAIVAKSSEEDFLPMESCLIYDTNGNLISQRRPEKEAEYVYYQEIPAKYIMALISIEDKKYYSHNGVDIKAVFRAAKALAENGKITQGGSTITMQLAKLMYMEPGKTWQYKVEQMFIAVELEKRYSKSQILEYYLNNIYFANGYYGIAAACHGYFDCEIDELDLSQVAFLMAIPNSPSYYDPLTNFDNTIDRRNLILQNLLDDEKITNEQYLEAVTEEIVLKQPQKKTVVWNNYVDTYAYHCATKAMMENEGFEFRCYFDTKQEEAAYDEEYDELYAACQKKLHTEGCKIYTSIDMELQNYLQESVDKGLSGFTEVADNGVYELQGAAVCIDNSTGYVVAIVGGRSQDFSTYTLNRAYQSHRQPGSSIKPLLVYTPSFERGYTPDSIVVDEEIEGGPSNAGGGYAGEVTIRYAVQQSINTIAWKLYDELTPAVGLQYLKNMNFTNIVESDYVLPTALGGFTTGVSALEMAAGYETIENDGGYREPTCIRVILDGDGKEIYASDVPVEQIYDVTASRMMTDVLTTVMDEGTGKAAKLSNISCAGKTGTTNSYKDGWFVGYTKYYTTSVWVGYDMPREVPGLRGTSYPIQIWKGFMEHAHEGLPDIPFLPYAQLSDEFVQQQEEERQKALEQREEENNPDAEPQEGAEPPEGAAPEGEAENNPAAQPQEGAVPEGEAGNNPAAQPQEGTAPEGEAGNNPAAQPQEAAP